MRTNQIEQFTPFIGGVYAFLLLYSSRTQMVRCMRFQVEKKILVGRRCCTFYHDFVVIRILCFYLFFWN